MKAMIYGSGDVKLYAFIGVTYPEGSTCTCTNGIVTLKTKGTSGSWAFRIPKAGDWTVSCTNGEYTKSETVSITAEGQFATVKLVYELWLYDEGNEFTSVTGGWSGNGITRSKTTMKVGSTWSASSGYDTGTGTVTNTIDFGEYKTLNIGVTAATSNGYTAYLGIRNASGTQIAKAELAPATAGTTVTLDISDLYETSGTITITAPGTTYVSVGDNYSSVTFDKVWFSPE